VVNALQAVARVGGESLLSQAIGDVATLRNNSAVPLKTDPALATGASLTPEKRD
jgi:hypothetical protein